MNPCCEDLEICQDCEKPLAYLAGSPHSCQKCKKKLCFKCYLRSNGICKICKKKELKGYFIKRKSKVETKTKARKKRKRKPRKKIEIEKKEK